MTKPTIRKTSHGHTYLSGELRGDQSIIVLAKKNPKKVGTASYDRFQLYYDKKPRNVEVAVVAGLTLADIRWDVAHGFISLGE